MASQMRVRLDGVCDHTGFLGAVEAERGIRGIRREEGTVLVGEASWFVVEVRVVRLRVVPVVVVGDAGVDVSGSSKS